MPKIAKDLLTKMVKNNKQLHEKKINDNLINNGNSNNTSSSLTNILLNINQQTITTTTDDKKSNSSINIIGDDTTTNSSNADDFDLSFNSKNKSNLNQESIKNELVVDDNDNNNKKEPIIIDTEIKSFDILNKSKTTKPMSDQSKIKTPKNKSDIEIIDNKINKCKYEITILQQKLQYEWSKHMNQHMNNFYTNKNQQQQQPDELVNKKPLIFEYNQIEKNIKLLNKKLQTYEKRKEKALKQQDKQSDQESASSSNCSNNATSSEAGVIVSSIGTTTTTTATTTNTTISTGGTILDTTNKTKSLNRREMTNINNNNLTISRSLSNEDLKQQQQQQQQKQQHFLQPNIHQHSNIRLTHNYSTALLGPLTTNDDQNMATGAAATLSSTSTNNQSNVHFQINEYDDHAVTNSYTVTQKRDYIIEQMQQDFLFIKEQQLKIQADFENLQKRVNENTETIIKEIKINHEQSSEPIRNIAMNLLKSNEQKFEDFKSTLKPIIQAIDYKVKENQLQLLELVNDIKTRVQSIESSHLKTQANNLDNATDYYQLFTKLFDIILTVCAIFLLVLNNTASFIKYIFSSSPRFIIVLLLLYFIIYNYFKLDHFYFINEYFNIYKKNIDNSNINETTIK